MSSVIQKVVEVGSNSTEILDSDSLRKLLILTNDSDEIIYLSMDGSAAEMNKGIRLNASGGSILLDTKILGNKINGICTSGGKNLLVVAK